MKQQSYDTFWQKIHAAAKKDAAPLRVMFELTYRCNFKCKHCYVPPRCAEEYARREIKTKHVFSILGQLKDAGCFYLGFTGGEPLLRKDFLRILKNAKKRGFEVIIYSNGSLIDKNMAARFGDLGVNKVDITIPGMSRNVFERITQAPGARKKVFQAIELLHKNRVPLGFKTCLLKDNGAEIKDIQHFARFLKAPHRLDTGLLPRWDGSKEPFAYRVEGSQDTGHRAQDTGHRLALACGIGRTQAAITPAGELKICVMIDRPKYDILDGTFAGSWEKLKAYVRCHDKAGDLQCPEREADGRGVL